MSLFYEPERRRAEIERHRENRGRLAHVYAKYTTTGQGTAQFTKRVDFGLTFVQEPFLYHGCVIDPQAVEDLLGLGPRDDLHFPQATGYVTEWDQDAHGLYVGAWVAATVTFPLEIPVDAQIEVTHHFTFAAIAIKSFGLPDDD